MRGKGVLGVRGLHLEAWATCVGRGCGVWAVIYPRGACGGCGEGDETDEWGRGVSGRARASRQRALSGSTQLPTREGESVRGL
jgi:hypothetical protein